MRKLVLYFLLTFISLGANAQDYNWQVLSTAGVGGFTGTSLTYSIAYFQGGLITDPGDPLAKVTVGPRVYVATRENGLLDVLDASSGAFVKTIVTASSGYKNTKIRTTETGEIYSVDMKLAHASNSSTGVVVTGSYKLDENSTAVAISFPYPPGMTGYPRMGEAFDVVGSGPNATFFITGSGSSVVYIYKRNGTNMDFVRSVDLGGGIGFCSLSVIPNVSNLSNSNFFVSHNSTTVARKFFKYDSVAGTYSASTIPTIIHDQSTTNNFSQLKYFSIAGQGYLATTGGSVASAKNLKIFKIIGTDLSVNASFELVLTLSDGAYTYGGSNGGQSDLVFSKTIVESSDFSGSSTYNLKLFQLVTMNAISAYTVEFNTNGTLPVTLTSFTASLANNQNTLNWSTSSENNSAGFEIESSTDGVTFNNIGFVASKGSGTSSGVSTYAFQDKNAASGTTYYRLKQVDRDGKFEYSAIKYVNNTLSTSGFSIYPNPAVDYVEISGADMSGVTLQLFTTGGVQINTKALTEGNKLNVSGLNAGVYVLRILKNGQLLQTTKLLKK